VKLATGLSILCAALLALGASAARAAEWVAVGGSAKDLVEIDLASVEVKKDTVKVWIRMTYDRPQQDEETHKPFLTEMYRTTEDCSQRTHMRSEFVRRAKDGEIVRSGATSEDPKAVLPGSIGEGAWQTACAIVHPPKEKPYAANFRDGGWRDLGEGEDRTYAIWLKTADIVQLGKDVVMAIARSDLKAPKVVDAFAVRHVVTAYAIDCKAKQVAEMGEDVYVAPDLRVSSHRVDPDEADFVPIPPKTFLARYLKDICSSARPLTDQDSRDGGGDVASGTAWGVDKGYLATAAHVIEGAKRIDVYRDGEKIGEAKVVVADSANDLAILAFVKHPAGKLKILPLASGPATLGRSVFTLGYPAPELMGQAVKMTSGQINSTSGMQDDTRMLQISVPVQGGNSGGPVLGWDGSVIGVVDSKLQKLDEAGQEAPQNVNYAVKASYLRPLLDDLPDLGDYEPIKAGASQEQTIAAVREAVFMLLVAH
jgi:S1-C subfamily serine protease